MRDRLVVLKYDSQIKPDNGSCIVILQKNTNYPQSMPSCSVTKIIRGGKRRIRFNKKSSVVALYIYLN